MFTLYAEFPKTCDILFYRKFALGSTVYKLYQMEVHKSGYNHNSGTVREYEVI